MNFFGLPKNNESNQSNIMTALLEKEVLPKQETLEVTAEVKDSKISGISNNFWLNFFKLSYFVKKISIIKNICLFININY